MHACTCYNVSYGCKRPHTPKRRFGQLSALVSAPGHGQLLVNSIDTPYVASDGGDGSGADDARKSWAAQLVFDRMLVTPGDDLHVTGILMSLCYVCASHIYGFGITQVPAAVHHPHPGDTACTPG